MTSTLFKVQSLSLSLIYNYAYIQITCVERFMFSSVGPVVPMATSMDPFEVRMQFLSLIRKLNASVLLSSRSTLT